MQEVVNFYPHKYEASHSVEQAREMPTGSFVSIAGRVMSIRPHGKTSFVDVYDEGTKIQLCFRADEVSERKYMFFKEHVRRGDIIGVQGTIFKTKTGEQTIDVGDFQILCKALYQLPNHWYGLKDVEVRYRNRHLDLLLNQDVRRRFELRSRIIADMRKYMDASGFREFETPIIQPVYGGADAKPFTTHVNALSEDWFLQIAPELYLKRLVIGGFNKVYTITKNFRNEDIDSSHNPEFTMMEAYEVNADYNDMMKLTQELITHINWKILRTQEFNFKGRKINFTPPWKKLTMYDSLEEYAGLKVEETTDEEIKSILAEYSDEKIQRLLSNYNRGLALAKLFDLLVQPKLVQPTFIIDYPKETTSLCKLHRRDPELIERFELFVDGMELANAYTELNDAHLQEKFFLEQLARKNQGYEEAHPFDEEFLEALKYGMPPTGGLGIGIDRLIMILTGAESIKEVILWPMLRRGAEKSKMNGIPIESIPKSVEAIQKQR